MSDQDAKRTVPQTRQKGLPTSQPEECLQLAHLAYRGDIKPEAFLRIVTESCVLPPGVGGQAQQITHPQRTAKAIARVSIRPITSHIMIPWIKIRVRESRVRPAKPARVFDNSETNDAKK